MKKLLFVLLLLGSAFVRAESVQVQQLVSGLGIPWGMAFIESGKILFTERGGKIGVLNLASNKIQYLKNTPKVFASGQGGLLDVAVPEDYQSGDWIYFTYSKNVQGRGATTLAKAHLIQGDLKDWTEILVTQSATDTGRHFGSRIAFDDQGHLFFSVGDRGQRPNGQNLKTHAGSILRINRDGSIPSDNPFINERDAKPEIWSYGHRNPQGLAWDKQHERLWAIEHGPRGGDEINLIGKGKNYGWPTISYGQEYWGPVAVGEGTQRKGLEQPVKYYVPSIAPGSLMLYSGDAFPEWKGDLFAGALKLQHLNRITLDQRGRAKSEERLLKDLNERIRALLQSPEGWVYFSTDSGKIFALKPKP